MSTSLSLPKLKRIFISHLHGDHCFGLFGLLGSRSMSGGTRPLDIYGPRGLEVMVMTVLAASDTHLTFPLEFHEVPDRGVRVVETDDETIDAVALDHRVTSFGWSIREADRPGAFDAQRARELGVHPGPDFGRLQRGEAVDGSSGVVSPGDVVGPDRSGRTVIIAGDNRDPERMLRETGPVQVLVHEATFTEDVLAKLSDDRGHSTAARVGKAAEQAGVGNLVLTHFSPRYGPPGCAGQSVDDVKAEAEARYSGVLHMAEDHASFELDHDGILKRVTS